MKLLHIKATPRVVNDFFVNFATRTINDREQNKIVRKDLMQFLVQLRNNSDELKKDDDWNVKTGENVILF